MKAARILFGIITICLVFSSSSVASAEFQGNLFTDKVFIADGESFNIAEFNEALKANNIADAEAIYNEWVKRRQEMLSSGNEFGRILYVKKNYAECIAAENEILDYLFAHLNEGNEKNVNWLDQIYHSMRYKKSSYDRLKDYANSLTVQKEIVNFIEERLPADNPNLLKIKMVLSACYRQVKDYKAATALDEELLPRFEKVFGANAPETLNLKHNLAIDYSNSSRYSDKTKTYEELLKNNIEVYGEKSEKTLSSYNNLIVAYIQLGKYEDAGVLLNRAIPIAEEILNDDSDLKLMLLANQARYYSSTQQQQKATEIYDRVLTMPINSKKQIWSMLDIYTDYVVTEDGESFNIDEFAKALQADNIADAEAIYDEWFKRRQEMLEKGSEFGIFDMLIKYCQARILYAKKNYAECIAAENEVLDYLFAHLNEGNEKNVSWLNCIYHSMRYKKLTYDKLKDYANSLSVQKELVNFMEERLPADNPTLLKEKRSLSVCYTQVKDYKAATALDEDLVPRFEKVFGANDAETLKVKSYLAEDYEDSLRYSDLAKLYEDILKTNIEVYGETAEETLASYNKMISIYLTLRKYEEATILLNRLVPLAEENLRDNSDLKISILWNQAIHCSFTRQMQKASEIFNRILAMPVDNRIQIAPLFVMADNYRCLADYSNALKYILKVWDIYEKNFRFIQAWAMIMRASNLRKKPLL